LHFNIIRKRSILSIVDMTFVHGIGPPFHSV